MEKLKEFLKGVRDELKRVVWPSRELVVKATISVIIFSLAIGVYLWILDLTFTKIISFILSLRGSL
ncbi:preprotein translocase subunit SecE [Aquifex aeolicus]|uniref:Protein translocase subunit SecE n=1 Tax=Aquifex aeolicus (strain VF5) TaxID=224324 RepID=SECE_AQUAE|nr:preprotein translocase subunit SecE [Aquifex aeolicus]D0VWU4.1 RecName: Full=Protein translocase subunit SecE [Aquifex aeolicus VF5]3DL8_C Chain C, SecE [Aquifex aeolicus]3DL8_D Chain D, SecE [Aquifex aeolicus]